ncbi:AT-hook motif nuclear-localized protein 1 [Nymphaea thermarum]|nr:AT-hook motif nuclear-localized protein 1 [Nymphaea thermarum]
MYPAVSPCRDPRVSVSTPGRFEILCLSGSYLLSEDGGTRSRTGGLSVSLASPDGRVVGGGVAGLLIAASPVQVIVGSFTYGGRKTQSKQESSDQVRPEPPMASNIGMSDKTGASSGMMHGQNPGVVSQSGWPGSRSMDIRNSHIDIDLTLSHSDFHKFIKGLQPPFKLLSRNTVRSDCMYIYEDEMTKLRNILEKTNGRISLTFDMWT